MPHTTVTQTVEPTLPVDRSFIKSLPEVGNRYSGTQTLDRLYKDKASRWSGIPRLPSSTKALIVPLTKILNEILMFHDVFPASRFFFNPLKRTLSLTPSLPLPLPSLVLSGDLGPHHVTSVLSPLEVVLHADADVGLARLAEHASGLLQAHKGCLSVVVGMLITEKTATAVRFSQSGGVRSEPLEYHNEPDLFCKLVSGLFGVGNLGFVRGSSAQGGDSV